MEIAGSVRTLVTTHQTIRPHKPEDHNLPCAIAQAISYWLVTTEAQVQSQTIPRVIYCQKSGNGTGFFIEYVCFPVSIIPSLLQTHITVIHHWCYNILPIDAIARYVFTTMKIAPPIWFINEIVLKTYNKVFFFFNILLTVHLNIFIY